MKDLRREPGAYAGEAALVRELVGRRFSFHPPVRNIRHNEWAVRHATWSECWIANLDSGMEFVIPQSFIGAISHVDEPVILVALRRELRRTSSELVPVRRKVIELPRRAEMPPDQACADAGPARVTGKRVEGIRIESQRKKQFAKRTSLVLLMAALVISVFLGIVGDLQSRGQVVHSTHADASETSP
jgi:hypothetical protein